MNGDEHEREKRERDKEELEDYTKHTFLGVTVDKRH